MGRAEAQTFRTDLATRAFDEGQSKPAKDGYDKVRCAGYWYYWAQAYSLNLVSDRQEASLPLDLREKAAIETREQWIMHLQSFYSRSKDDVLTELRSQTGRIPEILSDFDYVFRGDEFSHQFVFSMLGECRLSD